MHRRNRGQAEDRRYAAMLGDAPFSVALRKVFATQTIALWFVSLPIQVSAVAGAGVVWVLVAGIGLWLVGALFETIKSEEHTPELQSLLRISYAVFCLKTTHHTPRTTYHTLHHTSTTHTHQHP